jgi:hypothetical protein
MMIAAIDGMKPENKSIKRNAATAKTDPVIIGNMDFLIRSGVAPNVKYQAQPINTAHIGKFMYIPKQDNPASNATDMSKAPIFFMSILLSYKLDS